MSPRARGRESPGQGPADFPRTMNATDSLMWRVEADPLLRSTVTAVSVLDRPPDWDELCRRLAVAVGEVPRLTQRVRTHLPIGSPTWEHDPHFDLSYHLRRLQLQDATFDAVLAIASASAMGGFDRSRPPWEFVVVEGLDGGRAVLVQKFHHSMTDGVGGLRLAALLFDLERDPTPPTVGEKSSGVTPAEARETTRTGSTPRLLGLPAAAASALLSVPRALGGAAFRASRSPVKTVSAALDTSRWAIRLLAPVSAPLSPVLRGRSASLHFEAFDVDLAAVRAAARGAGCKVNDVFLAAVVGGLARYHAKNGVHVDALRMTLPISIRTDSDPLGSNRITLVRFEVPCGDADVRSRLSRLSEIVSAWRSGPALRITDLLARGLNALPGPAVSAVFGEMLKNVDFVATNVPGFPVPFYVAGAEVVRLYAFAPTCGSALNVSLVSHVGRCCIGVSADPAAVADTSLLVGCLQSGFDEVLAVTTGSGGATPVRS